MSDQKQINAPRTKEQQNLFNNEPSRSSGSFSLPMFQPQNAQNPNQTNQSHSQASNYQDSPEIQMAEQNVTRLPQNPQNDTLANVIGQANFPQMNHFSTDHPTLKEMQGHVVEDAPLPQGQHQTSAFEQKILSGLAQQDVYEDMKGLENPKYSDQQNIKCSIEIKNGIPQRSLNNFHKNTNALILNNYTGFWGIFIFLYETLIQFDHGILLLHFITELFSGQEQTKFSYVVFVSVASIIATGGLNIIHDTKLKQAAEQVNQKPVEKFIFSKRHKSFQISDWGSIQTGDIIKIKSSQEIPCDCLILNIIGSRHDIQTCYQRGGLFDDPKNLTVKRSYQGTMNKAGNYISDSKFADQISGLIKWEYNHQGYITGDFKQIDNPAAFEIQPQNIVQRGCYVSHCQFMVCLALNVGQATMGNGFRSPEHVQTRIKKSLFQKRLLQRPEGVIFRALRSIQLFAIIFCLLPGFLILFQVFALRNSKMVKFITNFELLSTDGNEIIQATFQVLSGFMVNLPYLAHICMEAVVYFHAYFVLWDVNLVPAQINFTNLRTMKTLGQVDSIICSKSAFMNNGQRYVSCYKVNDCFVSMEEKTRGQIGSDQNADFSARNRNTELLSQNSSSGSEDEDADIMLDYLPNLVFQKTSLNNQKALEMLKEGDPNQPQFTEFLLSLVLCHQATVQRELVQVGPKNQNQQVGGIQQRIIQNYKSLYQEEEQQLKFAESYGYQFKSKNSRIITVTCQGFLQRFQEILVQKIAFQGDYITIQVIRPQKGTSSLGMASIYFKANLPTLTRFLKKSLIQNIEQDIEKCTKEGIHPIGIAKTEIDGEDAVELGRILNESQGNEPIISEKNSNMLLSLATNLELVGILGMKNHTNNREALLMEELRQNGVKLFMLSPDNMNENITDLNSLKMFSNYKQPINVTGRSDRQVEESLKSCLKHVIEKRTAFDGSSNLSDLDFSPEKTTSSFSRSKGKKTQNSKKQSFFKKDSAQTPNQKNRHHSGQYQQVDFFDLDQMNAVFVNGVSLGFILNDETLTKLFLTLCSLCTLVVGSSVTAYHKRDLTQALRQFSIQGKQGYVVSVVATQTDKFTSHEADITVGIAKNFQQSDLLACSDVQMKDIYGISYLLFHHGTILHRRLRVVLEEFLYRTILLFLIQGVYFTIEGFTANIPFNVLFFASQVAIISPILFCLEGIFHTDYGYGIFHRIFGEYKFNKIQNLNIVDFSEVITYAILDAFFFCVISVFSIIMTSWDQQVDYMGRPLPKQTQIVLNSLILGLFLFNRNRAVLCTTKAFEFVNLIFFLLSIGFIVEDDLFAGIKSAFVSPCALATLLFYLLYVNLKQNLRTMIAHLYRQRKRVERYQNIEDRLFMEEYEDSKQQFDIKDAENYHNVVKEIEETRLFSINQNLLKVHRSDSMDQILDRINISGTQSVEGRSNYTNHSMINKFNLKLNDINKEIEYNQISISDSQIKNYTSLIWTSIILYTILGLFKIFNQFLEANELGSRNQTLNRSDTAGNKISSIYIEILEVAVGFGSVYLIKNVKSIRSDLIIFSLIIFFNIMVNIYFFIDPLNPLIQIQFLYTIGFSHLIRLNSVFLVSMTCFLSAVGFLNIRIATIQEETQLVQNDSIQVLWQGAVVAIYIFFWTYYTYWDEVNQKMRFVTQFRQIKDLQKLKSIINILIPSLVRQRIQDGKKNFSEAQGEVTVVFIDLDNFDQLVSQYTGRELIELLDRVYNAFDSLCEQHSLQKIETVGKTYMACGGLKECEREIDARLLGAHHSVRVTDFSTAALEYAESQVLRSGKKLQLKIGMHTGEVISGVVGETKPQFSLIGPTINKTSRVCSKCPNQKILISKETHAVLEAYSNNFIFQQSKIQMKGIGEESVYTVQKRRVTDAKLIAMRRNKLVRKNNMSRYGGYYKEAYPQVGHPSSAENIAVGGAKSGRTSGIDDGGLLNAAGMNMDTYRYIDDGTPIGHEDSRSSLGQYSQMDQNSANEDSYEDDIAVKILKNNELKDDRQIVKNAAQNDRYNLVERPRFLLQFELREQESAFLHQLLKTNYTIEVFQLMSKSFIDVIISMALLFTLFGNDRLYIYALVCCGILGLEGGLLYYLRRLSSQQMNIFLFMQITGMIFSMTIFILNGPKFQNFLIRESQQVTLALYQVLITISRAISFRLFSTLQVILWLGLIIQNFFFIELLVMNLQTYIIDSVLHLVFVALLMLASHSREMKVRRQYNQQRIIEVELEKTEELLGKLVPLHVLTGIKNDQKVVDSLDNVTLLYTDMVGFTEFSKNSKPQDVVTLLSRLFSRFDQLCDQIGVYKVHTIGDCYVIMSYTGSIAKERRSQQVQIEEAHRVIQVAHEMIQIINEERSKTSNSALKNLDMRIGIHTGKIVGGIIGTKVVRYDIFGQDVLIANKMESNGRAGQVCISEATYSLIQKNNYVAEQFYFSENQEVEIGVIGKKIMSYKVDKIYAEAGLSSGQGLSGRDANGEYIDGEEIDSHKSSNTNYDDEDGTDSEEITDESDEI